MPECLAEARAEASFPASRASVEDAVEADQDLARQGEPTRTPPNGSLWRDRNFLTFWTGQAFGQFGAQITELAIPVLAVLVLNATEFEVGVLTAANVAAFLVVGLAGRRVDRPDAQAPRHDLGGCGPRGRFGHRACAVAHRRPSDLAPRAWSR